MQTQCPQCETQFRLTEEQLAAADGLVRCGVCNTVFNALETLPDKSSINPAQLADNTGDGNENETGKPLAHTDFNVEEDADILQAEADFDLFQSEKDDNAVADSVIPDELRHAKHGGSSPSVLATLLWSLAILFLGLTLVLEYAWFNRDKLAQLPQAKPWIERLCQLTDCKLATLSDPTQIELLSRNVYSHPNRKQALMVSLTLVNHAGFAQPYPDMQIDFSDIRGAIVAARRFHADEYRPREQAATELLPPEQPVSFTLEIVDPGKQAMTYEFNFL